MEFKHIVHVLDPYHEDAIALLQCNQSITTILPETPKPLGNATGILVRSETRLTESIFAEARNLKVVVKQGVGVDNIDLEAAKRQNVKVYNTPGLNSESVAELAITLALCLARRVCEIDSRIRRGERLVRSKILGTSLFGKTLGVVGMGSIGRVVAEKWLGSMKGRVIAYDPFSKGWDIPHVRAEALDELLREVDVVTLHVPLTKDTKNLIGIEELQTMKSSAILINCARGGVVDEQALAHALKQRIILGAGLDAMEIEPPTRDVYDELLELDNVLITPHIGSSTVENQSRSGQATVQTLLDALEGKELPNRLV